MSKDATSTRRSFLKSSAILATPLAAIAAPAVAMADDELKARLAKLEDEAAIRELYQTFLRRVNAGEADAATPMFADTQGIEFDQTVGSIVADPLGEPDAIEFAPDGKSATGRSPCAVEVETPIPQDSTLGQMAHAQGGGFVRRTERRVLKVEYVKAGGAWAIVKAEFALV